MSNQANTLVTPVEISGELLEPNEILNLIIDVSGYNKWSLSESREITDKDKANMWGGLHPEKLKEYYGVEIENTQTTVHTFSRKFIGNGEIYSLNVQTMPGYVHVELDSGSYGYSSEKLIANAQLRKYLKGQL
jgi:hypothetical protein